MPDPSLFFDARKKMGTKPGLHALVIGVSDYTHLAATEEDAGDGLKAMLKLESSALSAWQVAQKLKQMNKDGRLLKPLKTIRLLIAPAQSELDSDPTMKKGKRGNPTFAEIKAALLAWRIDAAQSPEEQVVFFFSGHGIRRLMQDTILLARDFLEEEDNPLVNAFNLTNVCSGMMPAGDFETIGREQLYLVDACRDKPPELDQLEDTQTSRPFGIRLNDNIVDNRSAPIFFATIPGGVAAGQPGEPTFFTQSLLWALDNGTDELQQIDGLDEEVWPLSMDSLFTGMVRKRIVPDGALIRSGLIKDFKAGFRKDAPTCSLAIKLKPEALISKIGKVELRSAETNTAIPFTQGETAGVWYGEALAGNYLLHVEAAANEFAPMSVTVRQFNPVTPKIGFPWIQALGEI
jgi:Caspase domain